MRVAKVVSLGIVALLVVACGGIRIPSIPPIPSFPSFPPFPSGAFPSDFPTPGPGSFSVDPATGICRLLSAAEVGAALGGSVTISDSEANSCTYTQTQSFATINVRTESGDLTAARFLLGNTATDITVNGMPGLSGSFINSPLVYVQRGDQELVVQGVLLAADEASMGRVVQLATLAATRW